MAFFWYASEKKLQTTSTPPTQIFDDKISAKKRKSKCVKPRICELTFLKYCIRNKTIVRCLIELSKMSKQLNVMP